MVTPIIDSVILKAKCIKKIDGDKNIGNIDELIKSLESYKEKVSDISFLKTYRFTYIYRQRYSDDKVFPIKIKLHGLTENIIGRLEYMLSMGSPKGCYITSADDRSRFVELTNCTPDTDNVIYDYVFDVESYPVSHDLEVELYRSGFDTIVRPISSGLNMCKNGTFSDGRFCCSFYRVAVGFTDCGCTIYENIKRCHEFFYKE